jgi:hypothetical protein
MKPEKHFTKLDGLHWGEHLEYWKQFSVGELRQYLKVMQESYDIYGDQYEYETEVSSEAKLDAPNRNRMQQRWAKLVKAGMLKPEAADFGRREVLIDYAWYARIALESKCKDWKATLRKLSTVSDSEFVLHYKEKYGLDPDRLFEVENPKLVEGIAWEDFKTQWIYLSRLKCFAKHEMNKAEYTPQYEGVERVFLDLIERTLARLEIGRHSLGILLPEKFFDIVDETIDSPPKQPPHPDQSSGHGRHRHVKDQFYLEAYIQACDKFSTTRPQLKQLAEVSDKDQSTWSLKLKETVFLLSLRKSLESKTKRQKNPDKKTFWSECLIIIYDILEKKADWQHERRKVATDMDQLPNSNRFEE